MIWAAIKSECDILFVLSDRFVIAGDKLVSMKKLIDSYLEKTQLLEKSKNQHEKYIESLGVRLENLDAEVHDWVQWQERRIQRVNEKVQRLVVTVAALYCLFGHEEKAHLRKMYEDEDEDELHKACLEDLKYHRNLLEAYKVQRQSDKLDLIETIESEKSDLEKTNAEYDEVQVDLEVVGGCLKQVGEAQKRIKSIIDALREKIPKIVNKLAKSVVFLTEYRDFSALSAIRSHITHEESVYLNFKVDFDCLSEISHNINDIVKTLRDLSKEVTPDKQSCSIYRMSIDGGICSFCLLESEAFKEYNGEDVGEQGMAN